MDKMVDWASWFVFIHATVSRKEREQERQDCTERHLLSFLPCLRFSEALSSECAPMDNTYGDSLIKCNHVKYLLSLHNETDYRKIQSKFTPKMWR